MSLPDDDPSLLRPVAGIDRQAGVLAWLPASDPVRFVLITSRRTGRWVFPKGGVDPGMTPAEAAQQEALEEAGLIGVVDPRPIGAYMVPKIRPPLIWTVEVTLYPMRIDEVLDVWIEADQRARRFVTLDEARQMIDVPELLEMAERFVDGQAGA